MRRAVVIAALCLFVLPASCSRGDDDGPEEPLAGVTDTLGEDTTIAPEPAAGDVPYPDELELDGEPGQGVEDASAPDAPAVAPGTDVGDGSSALPAWTIGSVQWDPPARPPTPVLASVRTGRHEGYDRLVIEMQRQDSLPGYTVRYVDRPLHECGSGHQVHPVGDGWLEIRLEPAQSHTEAGSATISREFETPDLRRGLKVYRTCDFEAIVTLVLAVDSPEPFRAFHLRSPSRVVVDVQR